MLLKNSAIYMLAKAVPALAAFIALSFYTHLLSPEEYGLYTLIFTAAVFAHNTVFNWICMGTMRFWASSRYSDDAFISSITIAYFKVLLIIIVPLLISLFIYWDSDVRTWIFGGFLLTLTLALFTIVQILLSAKIQPLKYALLTISTAISTLSLGALLAYLGYGAIGIIAGMSVGFFIPSLFMSLTTWKKFDKKSYDKALFKRLLVYGLPLASAALLEEFTKSADRFMLAAMLDKSQAGLYAVGYDISGNSVFMLMTAISLAAYPIIIKLLENDGKQAAYEYFEKYTVLLLGIAIPAVLGLILVGSNLVSLVIGVEYQATTLLLLPWITVALLLLGLQVFYFDFAFQLGDHAIGIVKIGAVIAITNLFLNYWLIPIMGIQGAAIATISSFALGSFLSFVLGRKYFRVPFPMMDFIKILLATFVMGLSLWWFKDLIGWGWLLVQLLIGIVSYFVMIIALNVMDMRAQLLQRLLSEKGVCKV
ncbi:MAG TPA: hypothetical protein EYG68_00940 [Leucothrix mucor]|nr:hypothetical protein [Leucothrix mucor]